MPARAGLFKSTGFKYSLALFTGIIIGHSYVPDSVMMVLDIIFGFYLILIALKGDLVQLFTFLPYFLYSEVYIRAFRSSLPNLFADYCLLAVFSLLLLKQGTKLRLYSYSFVFAGLYALIEIVDIYRTTEPDFARINVLNSVNLFIISFWASSNILKLSVLNNFLNNLKIAGIYVAGIVMSAHIFGTIVYTDVSSYSSSNGLAPVQLSAYLGLGVILLFLSMVNPLEKKDFFLNIAFMVIVGSVMLLTFSRGGLYFFAIIVMLYLMFNRKSLGSYFIILMLLPAAYIIYYFVVQTTNGLIIDRYQQSGTSGRNILIDIGFQIFKSEPLSGIGTGNFSREIVARHLYDVESGAHNEFVRAAAEHGIIGILTYWTFYVYIFFEVILRKGVFRQYSLYFFALFCLILVHNGLKIALQPALLVLIIATPAFVLAGKNKHDPGS